MHLKNLFFHIHYCNSRKSNDSERYSKKITRTLSHHELIFITGGKVCITFGGKRYPVKGAVLCYIAPDVLYSIEMETEDPFRFLSVHFSYMAVNFNDNNWDSF
jgi:glyoxylate utilization-related uncharacterized protein